MLLLDKRAKIIHHHFFIFSLRIKSFMLASFDHSWMIALKFHPTIQKERGRLHVAQMLEKFSLSDNSSMMRN